MTDAEFTSIWLRAVSMVSEISQQLYSLEITVAGMKKSIKALEKAHEVKGESTLDNTGTILPLVMFPDGFKFGPPPKSVIDIDKVDAEMFMKKQKEAIVGDTCETCENGLKCWNCGRELT
jgi:hypothetical protein